MRYAAPRQSCQSSTVCGGKIANLVPRGPENDELANFIGINQYILFKKSTEYLERVPAAKKIKKAEAIMYAATVAGKNGTPQMTYAILPAARLRSAPSKARRQNGIVIRGGYHFAAARLGVQ